MRKKAISILRYLDETPEWKTSAMLSAHFGISRREVKYIIKDLNAKEKLVISSQKGYRANQAEKEKIREIVREYRLQHAEEATPDMLRKSVIEKLFQSDEGLNVYDLAKESYVNETSIRRAISSLRKECGRFGLQLVNREDTYTLIGTEQNKRKMMNAILSAETRNGFVTQRILENYLTDQEYHSICEILTDALREHQYYFHDYAYMNLVIHLAVTVYRTRKGFVLESVSSRNEEYIRQEAKDISAEIFRELSTQFGMEFDPSDVQNFALLVESQTVEGNDLLETNIRRIVTDDAYQVLQKIIKNVSDLYYCDLGRGKSLTQFALHINNLLKRIAAGHYSKNPYVDYIKNACPLIYEISVYISDIIFEHTGKRIGEDEIAFIALHIGTALKNDSRLTAVLVCPKYYEITTNIVNEAQNASDGQINIVDVLKDEDCLGKRKEDVDLIISTIPLQSHYESPVVYVSPLMTRTDKGIIARKTQVILGQKRNGEVRRKYQGYFSRELFLNDPPYGGEESLIRRMCASMNRQGYVDEEYFRKVIEREKMSSTVFGAVAVPHSLKPCAVRNGVAVARFDKPVQWNGKEIVLVLLLAVQAEDAMSFGDFFGSVVEMLANDDVTKRLAEISDFDEFMRLLFSFRA